MCAGHGVPAQPMRHRHSTKLKRHRKLSGFIQKETGVLLGCKQHSAITHHEAGTYTPELKTALGYQFLYGTPVHELFPGLYAEARAEILERAQRLSQRVSEDKSAKGTYKLGRLARLMTTV